ncbi:MAG: molybdopterin-dependent oxidoreductase [Solirubrobacterales bacterium]
MSSIISKLKLKPRLEQAKAMANKYQPPKPKFPEEPPPGPSRPSFWRSPLRGPWLSSFLGSLLLPLILVCAVTGFLSHAAYNPSLGDNSFFPSGGISLNIYFFSWPTVPPFLYAVTQGLHVVCGVIAIPLLFAKLWSVMPKLFEWPPLKSVSHLLERISLALLVGGALFLFFTGVLNTQLYYPWKFSFVPSHYYAAFVFLGALALHVSLKIPTIRKAYREKGVVRPLRDDLSATVAEPYIEGSTSVLEPDKPTMSRRGMLGMVGTASAGIGFMMASQVIGGPLRPFALLAPHGQQLNDGPNGFQVNKTAGAVGIEAEETGAGWRLRLAGGKELKLSREQLLAMPQHTYSLPIACVEGWSTTQSWTGVRLSELASLAGAAGASEVLVESLQTAGSFNSATLSSGQISDDKSLLALKVNDTDLSLDHGFPARVIVPAAPGVHCTKWVSSMKFQQA